MVMVTEVLDAADGDAVGGGEPGVEVAVGPAPGDGDLFELGPAGAGVEVQVVGDLVLEFLARHRHGIHGARPRGGGGRIVVPAGACRTPGAGSRVGILGCVEMSVRPGEGARCAACRQW